ncbi:MAG: hypothetical protein RKO25_13455 [Candidatus Contendobacter sp.]|nr:hypothetical protein [Candidatus Contendobacter sp.]
MRAKSIGKSLFISILNQVVSSGTNFLLGFYLVRILMPVEFGFYSIGFTISLFYVGVGNALFLTQMVVHVPDKRLEDRLSYMGRMLTIVALFCLLTVLAIGLLLGFGGIYSDWLAQYLNLGFTIAAASAAYLIKEFFIRYAYTARKEVWALKVNFVVAMALVALLIIQRFVGITFHAETALWLYTVSNTAGAITGFVLVRLPLRTIKYQQLIGDVREAWVGGSWATGSTVAYLFRAQAYIILTAGLIGPVGVAYLNASRLLVTPVIMLTPALSQVFMPRLAAFRASNLHGFLWASSLFSALLLAMAIIYSLWLLSFADIITPMVFGQQYGYMYMYPLILVWCFVTGLLALRNSVEMVLQVLKQFRGLMLTNMLSAVVAVPAIVIFIYISGVQGAVDGFAFSELATILGFFWLLYRDRGKLIKKKCEIGSIS